MGIGIGIGSPLGLPQSTVLKIEANMNTLYTERKRGRERWRKRYGKTHAAGEVAYRKCECVNAKKAKDEMGKGTEKGSGAETGRTQHKCIP